MKIATISSMDFGGAGIGSQRRIEALRNAGLDVELFVFSRKHRSLGTVTIQPESKWFNFRGWRGRWKHLIQKTMLPVQQSEGLQSDEAFSNIVQVTNSSKLRAALKRFDIIHLHWVVGLLDYDNLSDMFCDKPVVWTLADMNPYTGGCHYSEGCDEYKRSCGSCPLLSHESELSANSWGAKSKAYSNLKNLSVICPSQEMKKKAEQSSLFANRPIHYIPNPFPKDVFQASEKEEARLKLGLPKHKKLLLFGADSLTNRRKGGDLLVESLLLLKRTVSEWSSIEVLLFGNQKLNVPFKSYSLGFIDDPKKLALAYSAADVFLFPSREDNAPLTVSEALFCNTPVVSFSVGNVKDIVQHKENGYIAAWNSTEDFAKGIIWVLENNDRLKSLVLSVCRSSAEEFHNNEKIVKSHIDLYENLLLKSKLPNRL